MTPESKDRADDPAATEGNSSEYVVYAQVAEAVDACIREGHAPDVDALVAAHPEQAAHIRELVPTLVTLHDLGHEAKVVQDRTSVSDSSEGAARQLGDYRIIREIGRGGMGVVYEAEQVSLGRKVALKVLPFAAVLDSRQLRRFAHEAQAAAQLHHTNIVPVFAVGCERGVHYYAMQYIEGQTLAAAIAELRQLAGVAGTPRGSPTSDASSDVRLADPPLAAAGSSGPLSAICSDGSTQSAAFFHAVANLGVDAAEALEHAHASGIVHRDIKPSNLLLDARGKIWIADFGLAHVQSDPGLTITGDLLGTIRYMSPEQALAKHALVDHRTDVYSLGVTLYELLTLEPAIVGEDRQELLLKIAGEDPRPPRQINAAIPRDLETIILKAIGKTPEERYTRARDLADDLRNYLGSKPIKAKRPTLLDRAMKWSRRHRTVVASAVALLVLVSVGLAVSTFLIWEERVRTQLALQRSETNVSIALDVLDQIYLQIAEQYLPRDSGLTNRDREILLRALQFYSQFADANADDDAVGVEAVRAFLRVGTIQYQLSRPKDAEATYRVGDLTRLDLAVVRIMRRT